MIKNIFNIAQKFGIKKLSFNLRFKFHNFSLFSKKNKKKGGNENGLQSKSR